MSSGRRSGKIELIVDGKKTPIESKKVSAAGCSFWVWSTRKDGKLGAYLNFSHTSYRPSVDVSAKAWIEKSGEKQRVREFSKTFTMSGVSSWGWTNLDDWPRDIPHTVHFEFAAIETSGFRCPPFYTFESTEDCPGRSDIVFLVDPEKKRLHASKDALAVCSSYFDRMFLSDFKESRQNEVTLEQESPIAFAEFLRFCHYCREPITKEYIADLTRMADYYDARFLAYVCEQWYVDHFDKFTTIELLKIVDQYKFFTVRDEILKKSTGREIKSLIEKNDGWCEISETVRLSIVEAKFLSVVK